MEHGDPTSCFFAGNTRRIDVRPQNLILNSRNNVPLFYFDLLGQHNQKKIFFLQIDEAANFLSAD